MSLTKQITIDQVTINPVNGSVGIRSKIAVVDTDQQAEIASQYHRTTLSAGSDVSEYSPLIQAICAAAWADTTSEQ